jgi:hypothetical protein
LRCALLGDCRLLYARHKFAEVHNLIGSKRLEALDSRAIRLAARTRRFPNVIAPALWTGLVLPLLRRNRSLMNKLGGYWVLSLDSDAPEHLVAASLPACFGDTALLMSDGFYRLVDTFRVFTDQTLIKAALERGVSSLLQQLRRLELGDPACKKYPRLKATDDASAVLITIR